MGLWSLIVLTAACHYTLGDMLVQEKLVDPATLTSGDKSDSHTMDNPKKRSLESQQWQYPSAFVNSKKTPKFSSWGGKRSDSESADYSQGYCCHLLETGSENQHNFSDWTPEAEVEDEPFNRDERSRFSSWGGKRTFDSSSLDEDIHRDTRGKFTSWGGKRTLDPMLFSDEIHRDTRGKFTSWGGKRSGELNDEATWAMEEPSVDETTGDAEKRGKFTSWGGKRNQDAENSKNDIDKRGGFQLKESSKGWKRKPLFSSWGGKRSSESPPVNIYDYIKLMEFLQQEADEMSTPKEEEDERQKRDNKESGKRTRPGFSSWGGKRVPFSSWGGKRSPIFTNWGKRRNLNFRQLIETIQSAIGKRYPTYYKVHDGKRLIPFSSWGGKRSDPNTREEPEIHHLEKRSPPDLSLSARAKRSPLSKYFINRYYLINSVLRDDQWASVLRPLRRGSDFYPWGGKR